VQDQDDGNEHDQTLPGPNGSSNDSLLAKVHSAINPNAFGSGGRSPNCAKPNGVKDLRQDANVAVLSVVLDLFPRSVARCSCLQPAALWTRF
jgi:hypothetical protein